MPRRSRLGHVMRGAVLAGLGTFALALAVVDAGLLLLRTPWGAEPVRRALLARVNADLAGQLTIDRLRLTVAHVTLENLHLRDPDGATVVAIDRVELRWAPLALLARRIDVRALALERPRLALTRGPHGEDNLGRALAARKSRPPTGPRAPSQQAEWSVTVSDLAVRAGEVVIDSTTAPGTVGDRLRRVRLEELAVDATGSWDARARVAAARVDLRGTCREPDAGAMHVRVDGGGRLGDGDGGANAALRVSVAGGELRLVATATPATAERMTASNLVLSLHIEELRLTVGLARLLVPSWPLRVAVIGTGEGRWSGTTGAASARLALGAGNLRLTLDGSGNLQRMALDSLALRAQAVNLSELVENGPPSALSLALDAEARPSRGGWTGQLALRMPAARLGERVVGPLHVRADLLGDEIRLTELHAKVPGLRLTGTGRGTRDRIALDGELRLGDLGAALAVVDRGRAARSVRGRGHVRFAVAGPPTRPGLRLSGGLADLALPRVRIPSLRVSLAVPDVRNPLAADVTLRVPSGEVAGRRLRDVLVELRAAAARVDASVAMAEPLSLRIAAGGRWRPGRRELVLDRSTVDLDGTRWALQRPAQLSAYHGGVRVRGLALAGAGGQSLALDLDRREDGLDARVGLELALARLPRALLPRGLDLHGSVTVDADVRQHRSRRDVDARVAVTKVRAGKLDELSLSSTARVRDGRVSGTVDGDFAGTTVSGGFALPLAWPPPDSAAVAAQLTVADTDLDRLRGQVRAVAALRPKPGAGRPRPAPVLPVAVAGRGRARLMVGGTVAQPSLVAEADITGLRLNHGAIGNLSLRVHGAARGPVEATLALVPSGPRAGAGTVELTLRAERPLGALLPPYGDLAALRSWPVALRGRLERVDLAVLGRAAGAPRALGGFVDGTVALDGRLAAPIGTLDLTLDEVSTTGIPPTDASLRAHADGQGAALTAAVTRRGTPLASIEASLAASPRTWGDADALADAALAVSATVGPLAVRHQDGPASVVQRSRRVLSGKVHGRLEASGTLRTPRVTADARASDVRLDGKPVGEASLTASYRPRRLMAEVQARSANGGKLRATAEVEHDLGLRAVPADLRSAPLTARLEASDLDIAALSAMSSRVRSLAGLLVAKIEVSGTVADPQPAGSLSLRDGRLTVSGMGEYRNVRIAAHGSRARWTLDELEADSGAGHADLRASGQRDEAVGGYRISSVIRADRVPAYVDGQALADVSLAAKVEGLVARGSLQADVDVESARLALRDVKRKKLQSLREPDDIVLVEDGRPIDREQARKLAALSAEPAPAGEQATVGPTASAAVVLLRAANDLWVRGKDANVELGIDSSMPSLPGLRVEMGERTRVYGRVLIKRGRVDVVGRRFDLRADSTMRWNGDPGLPELDVTADHVNESEQVTVRVAVKGSPGNLQTSLISPNRPDLTESQLYTLIVTGRLTLGGGSATSSTPMEQAGTVLGGLLAGQLQKVVAKKLPFDVLTIEGGSTAGSARVEAGKYLTPDFYVGYVGRLGADPVLLQNRNAVHLEYELGKRWSFEAEYGDAKTGSADVLWRKRY